MRIEDRKKVTLVSGFFGSGKTSFIHNILHHITDRRLGVIVNETGLPTDFPAFSHADSPHLLRSIDDCLIDPFSTSYSDALIGFLEQYEAYDHLIIEAQSELPLAKLVQLIRQNRDLSLHKIITIVDALHFSDLLETGKFTAAIHNQLDYADLFIMTKTEQANSDQLVQTSVYLSHGYPATPAFATYPSDTELSALLFAEHKSKDKARKHYAQSTRTHASEVRSYILGAKQPVRKSEFREICQKYHQVILRGRGIISTNRGRFSWRQIGKDCTLTPRNASLIKKSETHSSLVKFITTHPEDTHNQRDDLCDALREIGFEAF